MLAAGREEEGPRPAVRQCPWRGLQMLRPQRAPRILSTCSKQAHPGRLAGPQAAPHPPRQPTLPATHALGQEEQGRRPQYSQCPRDLHGQPRTAGGRLPSHRPGAETRVLVTPAPHRPTRAPGGRASQDPWAEAGGGQQGRDQVRWHELTSWGTGHPPRARAASPLEHRARAPSGPNREKPPKPGTKPGTQVVTKCNRGFLFVSSLWGDTSKA